jgi:hypothetical protein
MKQNNLSVAGFIFLLNCLISHSVMAQNADRALEKKITLSGKYITIDSLLRVFSRQTAIEFSFNSKRISPAKKVTIAARSQTLLQWLQNLKQEVSIDYKLVGNHLVLLDMPRQVNRFKPTRVYAANNPGKINKKVLPSNKINNSNVNRSFAVDNKNILPTRSKISSHPEEQVKTIPDTVTTTTFQQTAAIASTGETDIDKKPLLVDTTQSQLVNNAKLNTSPAIASASAKTTFMKDYKHHVTFMPGVPIFESAKYYSFSIGLDYDRKLLSFGNTVLRNNLEMKRCNLNLEIGVDYIFDKDSTRGGGTLIGHIFPDLIYKLGESAHIDLGAGLAVLLPSPASHLGYGVNLSVNFPISKQNGVKNSANEFYKTILLGAGIEMYEFRPDDPIFLSTLRLTIALGGKKR